MKIKRTFLLCSVAAGAILSGCRTVDQSTEIRPAESVEESSYQSRPKVLVESPVSSLPYTLKWEGSTAARSYEIQSASDRQFTEGRLSWTTRNNSFLLEDLSGELNYIRIRAHFNGESSRWSEVLLISQEGERINLERLRG